MNGIDFDAIEEALQEFQGDPFVYFEEVWGMTPQPIKHRYRSMLEHLFTTPAKYFNMEASLFCNEMFGDFDSKKHLTWQQMLLLIAVKRAINDTLPRQISVCSGKGTGKTFVVGGIILWFLFAFPLSIIMATAPTGAQLFSVLWSELAGGIRRMKKFYADKYVWQKEFIRIISHKEEWFARAKTSAPGESGALAGLHSPHMLAVVDEAASVEENVIDEARYTMVNENRLIILISNAHTATSYFKSTFEEGSGWVNLIFNAEESPIVSASSVAAILKDCGGDREHDKYRVHVRGLFPKAGLLDNEQGWRRLYNDNWIDAFFNTTNQKQSTPSHISQELTHPSHRQTLNLNRPYLGVDVGGDGDDSSEIYARDDTRAAHVFSESHSTPETVARLTIRAMEELDTEPKDTTIDNFGTGADVSAKIALLSNRDAFVVGLNVGQACEDPDDKKVYLNERARLADMLLQWGVQGGRAEEDSILRKELEGIYCREQNSKLQIMSKRESKKMGIPSPNRVDSLWLTFAQDRMFSLRVPRGDQLYYPDKQLPPTETSTTPVDSHRMIPS